jgi:uncharacterized phage protein gp47/JayE
MALSLEQLVTNVTMEQARKKVYDLLEAQGFPTSSWVAGGVARALTTLVALLFVLVTETVVLVSRAGFLDYATGVWLTLLAAQGFNVTRRVATFATLSQRVRLDNTLGTSHGPFQPFERKIYNPDTKKTYFITSTWSIGPLETGVYVDIQATEAGASSSAGANTITAFENPPSGVTVTNEIAVVGLDEETDPELRARCRAKQGALSPNGPKLAYDYVAKTLELNGGVAVNRTKLIGATVESGAPIVYLAGPSGALTSDDRDKVEDGILRWSTPQCVEPDVRNTTNVTVNVVQTVYIVDDENILDADLQAAALARLVGWVPTIPIRGYEGNQLAPGDIQAESTRAVNAFRVAVTTPAAPVALAEGEVVVLGTVTTNVERSAA